jgi:hypothetical protein
MPNLKHFSPFAGWLFGLLIAASTPVANFATIIQAFTPSQQTPTIMIIVLKSTNPGPVIEEKTERSESAEGRFEKKPYRPSSVSQLLSL